MNGIYGRPVKIYFDGGCRPNPGAMESAVVLRGAVDIRRGLGQGDNELAEWLALLHALEIATAQGERDVLLIGDSLSVIRQAQELQTCRSAPVREALARFQQMVSGFDRVRLRHAGRAQNLAGIALQREFFL